MQEQYVTEKMLMLDQDRKILEKYINDSNFQEVNGFLYELIHRQGFAKFANEVDMARESLYKAFRPEATMRYTTFLNILKTLNIKINLELIESNNDETTMDKMVAIEPTLEIFRSIK